MSLDTTAVLLTPVVLTLTRRLGLRALPFALLAVWLANTASLLLPVSNLTNLLALQRAHLGSPAFAARMALPELVAVAGTVAGPDPRARPGQAPPAPGVGHPELGPGVANGGHPQTAADPGGRRRVRRGPGGEGLGERGDPGQVPLGLRRVAGHVPADGQHHPLPRVVGGQRQVPNGADHPTGAQRSGHVRGHTVGFDCSGLVRFAVYQASGRRITLPRTAAAQVAAGTPVPRVQLQPGDGIGFADASGLHHIGIYLGGGQMLHAPETGGHVEVISLSGRYWATQTWYPVRFG